MTSRVRRNHVSKHRAVICPLVRISPIPRGAPTQCDAYALGNNHPADRLMAEQELAPGAADRSCDYSEEPLVSVVIPTYNGAVYLSTAIESVLAQTYTPMECIVIDDGSTDDTPAIIASFGPRIRGMSQTNAGFARARNRGARLARGELISFLDHDDCWRPTKVKRQVQAIAGRSDVAVVYTAVELIDERGAHLGTIPAPPATAALRNTILMEAPHLALEQGALIRREAFFSLGGFDERLTTSIGCDLACRLALDYAVEPVDEPLAAYRQHSEHQMHHDLSSLERDMRLIYRKLLARDEDHRRLLRSAQYNLDVCLANWYWREEQRPVRALWHAGRATARRPGHVFARLAGMRSGSASRLRLPSKRR